MDEEKDTNFVNEETDDRLPDSEQDIMMAIWSLEPPCSTAQIKEALDGTKDWKAPTLISFLGRLERRGFLTSVKNGRERSYTPLIDKRTYLSSVTHGFVDKLCCGSFVQFFDFYFDGKEFTDDDIDGLITWLENRK